MITQLDTPDLTVDDNADQLTQIDGVEYLIQFIWNDRENGVFINIFDQDENPIATCIKLVVSEDLLSRFTDSRLPTGLLYCADMTNTDMEIATQSDFGARVLLIYITPDDVAAIKAGTLTA